MAAEIAIDLLAPAIRTLRIDPLQLRRDSILIVPSTLHDNLVTIGPGLPRLSLGERRLRRGRRNQA